MYLFLFSHKFYNYQLFFKKNFEQKLLQYLISFLIILLVP